MPIGAICIFLAWAVIPAVTFASQDVLISWQEVRLKAVIDHHGYQEAEIIARVVDRADVPYLDELILRLDGAEVVLPKRAYTDLRYPRLETLELTYAFSPPSSSDERSTLYLKLDYGADHDAPPEVTSRATFSIDLIKLRLVRRSLAEPSEEGPTQFRDQTFENE